MISWLDGKMIMPFPFVFLVFFIVPWVLPAISNDLFTVTTLAYPREWLMNTLILPVLPYEWAVSLAEWWQQTDYFGEVLLQLWISANLFIPTAFILFGLLDLYKRLANWYHLRRYREEAQGARR